jgi:hypothetical protein
MMSRWRLVCVLAMVGAGSVVWASYAALSGPWQLAMGWHEVIPSRLNNDSSGSLVIPLPDRKDQFLGYVWTEIDPIVIASGLMLDTADVS